MKRYSLLLVPLVAVVFAVSCRDSTSPASRALRTPKNPELVVIGNKPPPPADAVIAVNINSPGSGIFTGVYFSNGKISDVGEPIATFDGTAWLRLDNKQPTPNVADASPNTRFMVKGDDTFCSVDPSTCPTGIGTFTFLESTTEGDKLVTYRIVKVDKFTRFNSCGVGDFATSPCAIITFRAEKVDGPACNLDDPLNTNMGCHDGNAAAFDKASCLRFNGETYYIPENCYVPSVE
jgi:hypothetical protein